jgi:transcriptional regulator with XRE-family HTH domain
VIILTDFLILVGNRIREIRKQKGLTQEQLAEKTGLQNSYVGGIERGERNISLLTLEKLLIGLEITAFELFKIMEIEMNGLSLDKKELILDLVTSIQRMKVKDINLIKNITGEINKYLAEED